MLDRPKIRPNLYSGVGLDRADARRADVAWIAAQIADPGTRFLPVWRSRSFVTEELSESWLARAEAAALIAEGHQTVFLGLQGETALVALDISEIHEPHEQPPFAGRGEFRDLREIGPLMPRQSGAILAYARGLMHWHRRHGFCGVCGAVTESTQGGHTRTCQNAACGASHFPRTDPAVIMLIHDGADRCLLGRQKIWPPGMHSTLAGFVEPGESLEEAVAREIHEEAGLIIPVSEVAYHSSQPWPFPASIMLGFYGRAEDTALDVNTEELESAQWYSRAELLNSPENETFKLPRKDSIARRLIEDWLQGV